MEAQELTNEEMMSLTQSILTRYGIDFTCYEPKSLRRRIVRIMNMNDLKSAHELWIKFLREPQFVKEFMNEVSVGMTSMFRDHELWTALKKRLMVESRKATAMRIWHAGCSTGEEVYSLGVLLQELQVRTKTTALATDFNENALREAREGVYHKVRMIENEAAYKKVTSYRDLANYYSELDPMRVQMNTELVNHVEFKYHNLITDRFPSGFDIIFCRNVMIYFDTTAKRRLLDQFHEALKPGGYFIIGFYDAVTNLIDDDKMELIDPNARIFRKRDVAAQSLN
jgi:chemotaxis protein methyltransferase CheR